MSQASQTEVREILAELKILIMEALEILSDKEKPANDKIVQAKT